jgi:hypothetical protein
MRVCFSKVLVFPINRGAAQARTYRSFAEVWVERAIAAGCNPNMRQQSLASEDAGEWLLVIFAAGLSHPLYPGRLPVRFLDDVFLILSRLGRIEHNRNLKPWHGNVLLDNASSRAVALRLKLIRHALHMDYARFYGAVGIAAKVGEALESGRVAFLEPDVEMLKAVCLHYDAPEEWLTHGSAEEIEDLGIEFAYPPLRA